MHGQNHIKFIPIVAAGLVPKSGSLFCNKAYEEQWYTILTV